MVKIVVYKVRSYDIATDGWIQSRRLATERGAEIMGGEIIPSSITEIDINDLEPGTEWTRINYSPRRADGGFQSQVIS